MTSLWCLGAGHQGVLYITEKASLKRWNVAEKMKFWKTTFKNPVQVLLKIGCQFEVPRTCTKRALSHMRQTITLTWKTSCTNTNSNFEPRKLGKSSHSNPSYTHTFEKVKELPPVGVWSWPSQLKIYLHDKSVFPPEVFRHILKPFVLAYS